LFGIISALPEWMTVFCSDKSKIKHANNVKAEISTNILNMIKMSWLTSFQIGGRDFAGFKLK
jgi:hypothetical protein